MATFLKSLQKVQFIRKSSAVGMARTLVKRIAMQKSCYQEHSRTFPSIQHSRIHIYKFSNSRTLTHFIPTTTVVVVTLSIPTTTVVVVAHCIPTTTFVVVDNDLSIMSAVNRPRARNPRCTCAVSRMCYHCLCTAAIEKVLCSLRAVLTKLVTIVAESLSSILPKWRPRMIQSVM